MILEITEEYITVSDCNNTLNDVGKSQLFFWGFEYDFRTDIYMVRFTQQLFLKIIRYFDNEQLKYELGNKAKKYSNDVDLMNIKFQNKKEVVRQFKSGKYNKLHFADFREFVARHIKRSLKIHQLKAAYHLYILENGANFSVPGSGKTSVVLTVYEKLRIEGKVNTLFVVGPPSCFGPWKVEFEETLGRKPDFKILAGIDKNDRKNLYYDVYENKSELYLTSYHSLFADQKEIAHFLRQKSIKAFFVVDEAHYMKQLNGNWANAVLRQALKVNYRCILTGTPMPKSYTDVFNLFDFLWPNENPITQEDKTLITYNEKIGNKNNAKLILNNSISPLFYRVRKSDLKLTPQNYCAPDMINMSKYERKIYDAIYNKIKDYSKKDYFQNIDFVNKLGRGRIIRLRQTVSYPKLLNTAVDDYIENLFEDMTDLKNLINNYDKYEIPAKIKYLIKRVKQLQKKKLKVVIWSNFIGSLKLIEKHLKNEGYYCKKIYGGTPIAVMAYKEEDTREKIRDEFVDPHSGLDILIANPAACAESISLHKTCHNAIYYDLSYNCAQYLQSLDRIHRVGGSENVEANYYYLQYTDTIDSDIKYNLDLKKRKMYEIIEEDFPIYSLDMFESDSDAEAYKRLFK
ncbi:MAG: DEAD/DEAH box helicase [Ignavibacteria bacterium]|nr:DEAD/DEAH box helicase [Ignavibacteria bacterium]